MHNIYPRVYVNLALLYRIFIVDSAGVYLSTYLLNSIIHVLWYMYLQLSNKTILQSCFSNSFLPMFNSANLICTNIYGCTGNRVDKNADSEFTRLTVLSNRNGGLIVQLTFVHNSGWWQQVLSTTGFSPALLWLAWDKTEGC